MRANRLDAILAAALEDNDIKYKNISNTEAIELLKTDYSHALEAYNYYLRVYRGDRNANKMKIKCSLAIPGIRQSQNTFNYYTKLMSDVLPSWSKYPPRNRSFICTLDYDRAIDFSMGKVYSIFPKNDTPIAICSNDDLWVSFQKVNEIGQLDMSIFNMRLKNLFENIMQSSSIAIPKFVNESSNEIKTFLSSFDNEIRKNKDDAVKYANKDVLFAYIVNNVLAGKNTLSLLDSLLNPEQNDFELVDDIRNITTPFREVWFSGECLMIVSDLAEYLIDDIVRSV